MDYRWHQKRAVEGDAARPRSWHRIAFAAALFAVPWLGVLVNAPLHEQPVPPVGIVTGDAAPTPDAAVYTSRNAPATPDLALLDANDVRRALPATSQPVAGLESTTL